MTLNKLNKTFNKEGIIFRKNFIKIEEKKIIKNALKKNLSNYLTFFKDNLNLEDQKFHNQLIKLRKNKKLFGELYDKINLSSDLRSIFYKTKFLKIFSKILNTDQVFLNGFMMRFDFPFDGRNSLDWHTDAAYYLQSYPRFNAGVCWLPVTNNSEHNGTLQYVKEFSKIIPSSKLISKNKYSTSQFILKDSNKIKNIKHLNQNYGDASFLHMALKHRSGVNHSDKVRISIACRFHSMSNFNIGKEIYNYNNIKIQKKDKFIVKKR